jgi:E1-E2 ATPase
VSLRACVFGVEPPAGRGVFPIHLFASHTVVPFFCWRCESIGRGEEKGPGGCRGIQGFPPSCSVPQELRPKSCVGDVFGYSTTERSLCLRVDESNLTGESEDVTKDALVAPMLLSGSKVLGGVGRMVVTAVGSNSQQGVISNMVAGVGEDGSDGLR